MRVQPRWVRGVGVGVVTVFMVSGAVFAANGLTPTQITITPAAVDTVDENANVPEAAETPEPAETPDAADSNQAPDPNRPQNHGWFTSQAAQGATPAGFANHGAYVSSIAKGTDGKPAAAAHGKAKGHTTH